MKNEITFGFVILHYMSYDITEKSINSILALRNESVVIAVVDNCSANGSVERLQKAFSQYDRVSFIINDENVGFARGNNVGYEFLKNNYSPKYIVVMNNDVVIEQQCFFHNMEELYERFQFGVLGPDILNPLTQEHQNVHRTKQYEISNVEKRFRLLIKFNQHPLYWYIRINSVSFLKKLTRKTFEDIHPHANERISQDMVLNGACYIFGPAFIDSRKYCFNPATFLYFEEDILAYECKRDGIRMIYSPEIQVKHFEDVSTNIAWGTGYKKFKRKNREMVKSCRILLDIMKQDDDNEKE